MDFPQRGLRFRVGGGEAEGGEGFLEEEEQQKIGEIGKFPSSQYKGVVPQPNGQGDAHIYENHQRVWLGTFDSEQEAASSYDRAAIRLRGQEALANFKTTHSLNTKLDFMEELGMNHHPEPILTAAATATANAIDSGEREHMFDKVVTPSDVGKLNRLVIPKQHAEKYFPLDSSSNEKGLLLNFEDSTGKPWRFRYSYWNSSQSYVMTKGWSRFVKEKKLDAGDTVSFERGVGQAGKDRLYIGWKHRPETHDLPLAGSVGLFGSGGPWGRFFWPGSTARPVHHLQQQHQQQLQQQQQHNYCNQNYYGYGKNNGVWRPQQVLDPRSIFYLGPQQQQVIGVHDGEGIVGLPTVIESVPVVHEKAATKKRLRLFGVNLECPVAMGESDDDGDGDGDSLSSATGQHPKWLSYPSSPSPLQFRLYNGTASHLPQPTMPIELPSNAGPARSFDLES